VNASNSSGFLLSRFHGRPRTVRVAHDCAVVEFSFLPIPAQPRATLARKNDHPQKHSESTFAFPPLLSGPLNFRFALLAECAKAFPAVFGSDEAIVASISTPWPKRDPCQAPADRVLRLPHGERSERGDTLGRPQRLPAQLAGLAEFVSPDPRHVLPRAENGRAAE